MKGLKLFALRTDDGTVREDLGYFYTKGQARVARDKSGDTLFITVGPDHWRFGK